MMSRRIAMSLAAGLLAASLAAPAMAQSKLGNPAALTEQAPATYKAKFETSKGTFVVRAADPCRSLT